MNKMGCVQAMVVYNYGGVPYVPIYWTMNTDAYRVINLYPISVMTVSGTQWGYMNDRAAIYITPRYDYAYEFQRNGLAAVSLNDQYGLIRLNGEYVVKPSYNYINEFIEGRAVVIGEKGFGVIDEAGKVLTHKDYDYIGTYHNGRALYSRTDSEGRSSYGYLDLQGQEVIPAQYRTANDFTDGKAVVQVSDQEYALIGLDGQRITTYPYTYVGSPSEGLLPFQQQAQGKYGYINEQGKVVIPPRFTGAQAFQEGRAVVNIAEDYHNKYGLIDRTGKFIMNPQYNSIELLGEERAAIGEAIDQEQPYIGSKYALADSASGKFLTGFMFYQINNFSNGVASAYDSKQTFFINRQGNVAPYSPRVNGSGTMRWVGSLVSADVDRRISYYDRWGNLVWKQNSTLPLTGKLRVKEELYKPNRDYLVYYPQLEGMADSKGQQRANKQLKELSQVKPIPGDVQLDYNYTGDFEISFYRNNLIVFKLHGYNYPFGAAHGMPTEVYAPVNLKTGRIYELKDLFKPDSDYVKVLSTIIGEQIKTDPQYSYVFPDTYKGIQQDQPFFVTEDTLNIYFAPYEIGPYAAGFPTFTIPWKEINRILDREGSFWKSFH
jgi:hypothetical protein